MKKIELKSGKFLSKIFNISQKKADKVNAISDVYPTSEEEEAYLSKAIPRGKKSMLRRYEVKELWDIANTEERRELLTRINEEDFEDISLEWDDLPSEVKQKIMDSPKILAIIFNL